MAKPNLNRWRVRVSALGVVCMASAAIPARADTQPPARPPANTSTSAIASLIESANYWRSNGDSVAALHTLDRALGYAPSDPNLLASAAEVAFGSNNYDLAAKYRAKLAQIAPEDPRNKVLAAEHPLDATETAALASGRDLARQGKTKDALAQYAKLFHDGALPPRLAVEYYSLLGSTEDGFDEASDKLGALAEESPDNAQLQLAFARLQTTQEGTRADGFRRLARLAESPEVGIAARQQWHDALLWQGPSEKARTQLETYLKTNPSDAAIDAKQREFAAVLPDDSAKAMIRGYNMMAADPVGAEREFRAALAINPKNPDAMVMIAGILRSWKRPAEAQVLINHAVALAPERHDELIGLAGGDYANALQFGMDEKLQVASLIATGNYADAEDLLTAFLVGHETPVLLLQLADTQRRAGHLDAAEQSFRKVAAIATTSGDPTCGLGDVRVAAGRFDEAAALYTEAESLYAKANDQLGQRKVAIARAALVHAQAASMDPAARVVVYAAAQSAKPANMYIRVDYAWLLMKSGHADQAWAVLGAGVDQPGTDPIARHLAVRFAVQNGDADRARTWSQAAAHTDAGRPVGAAASTHADATVAPPSGKVGVHGGAKGVQFSSLQPTH